jgi:HEAT repeat protein
LTAELASKSLIVQTAAIRILNEIPGQDVTGLLALHFPKLSPAMQALVVSAVADRGGPAALPLLLEAIKSTAAEVRVAALQGLGKAGDPSSVMLLAEAAANREGREQAAARESLYGVRGTQIEFAVVSAIGSTTGKIRTELVSAAGERGITAAAEVLMTLVQGHDAEVRSEAFRALRNVAGPQHISALIQLVTSAEGSADRSQATRSLAAVLKRTVTPPIDKVISAYTSTGNIEVRRSFVEVMGQAGDARALPVLRNCLKDPSPDISRAAILALSEWSTATPVPDLLAVAASGPSAAHELLALRGAIRLAGLPSQEPPSERARLLASMARLASQPAEKRSILSLLANYPSTEGLAIAESFLEDTPVSNEAKIAVERIRTALGPGVNR